MALFLLLSLARSPWYSVVVRALTRKDIDGKRVLNLCANNHLGLANHPRLREAAHAAIERFGVGPAAVRSIVGTLSLHTELEQKLAAFKGVEATLTLQSGFAADLFPSSSSALRVRTDGLCRSLACAVQRLCEGSCT